MSMRRTALKKFNGALRPVGFQLIHGRSDDPAIKDFIRARPTIAAAKAANLSLTDYIDMVYATPGTTSATVQAMLDLAQLPEPVRRVCEIGPGSGRYAERVIAAVNPNVYEIYETATDWLPHLRTLPGALVQPSDGRTLASTATASVDLVHAQKVFVYLDFATMVGYFGEMIRVARPGGVIAFDIVSERCLDDEILEMWVNVGHTLYRPIPREWVVDYFRRRDVTFIGDHRAILSGGKSDLLVFRRS
jgi:hypothetical protein